MTGEIIVALIVGAFSFAGTALTAFFANRKNNAIVMYKIESLEKELRKHNNVIERTYKLENDVVRLDTKLNDMEKGLKK